MGNYRLFTDKRGKKGYIMAKNTNTLRKKPTEISKSHLRLILARLFKKRYNTSQKGLYASLEAYMKQIALLP